MAILYVIIMHLIVPVLEEWFVLVFIELHALYVFTPMTFNDLTFESIYSSPLVHYFSTQFCELKSTGWTEQEARKILSFQWDESIKLPM